MRGSRLAARPGLALGINPSGQLLPLVIALLVYVAGLSGAGLVVLDDALRASEQTLAASLTLQVPAEASNARLETVMALLRQTPGIASIHLLDAKETARLLEPWLGSMPLDDLPVPRLVDLRVDPKSAIDLAALQRQLGSVVPDARLADHRRWSQEMDATARRVERLLWAAVTITLLLIAVAAAIVARAGLIADRSFVELLHLLGAADADIVGGFAASSVRMGLVGGAIGAAAALATIAALNGTGSIVELPVVVAVKGAADWRVWAILAVLTAAAGLLAMAGARIAVRRQLTALP
jgi:cell division transport system permease protein